MIIKDWEHKRIGNVASSASITAIRYGVLKITIHDYAVAFKHKDYAAMDELIEFLESERGQIILGNIDTGYFIRKMKDMAQEFVTKNRHFILTQSERQAICDICTAPPDSYKVTQIDWYIITRQKDNNTN